ncbi:MAG: hypothetical protein AB200_01455 [Parcubacteria bacterium C7867-005]|nr:MAG: hypothetical protein AB200_01455 [Parcubacteria bacterium C7867-005]
MFSFITFILSGVAIALLITAKIWEIRKKKTLSFLSMISKGDARFREMSHDVAHEYSVLKEKAEFFVTKQLPIRTKNILNKAEALVKDQVEKRLGNIRNSRLLNTKNEGISEFFKNISDMEIETAEALKDMDREESQLEKRLDVPEEKL